MEIQEIFERKPLYLNNKKNQDSKRIWFTTLVFLIQNGLQKEFIPALFGDLPLEYWQLT